MNTSLTLDSDFEDVISDRETESAPCYRLIEGGSNLFPITLVDLTFCLARTD